MMKIWLHISITLLCINTPVAGDNMKVSAPPSIWAQEKGGTLTGPIIDMLESMFAEFDITITPVVLPWARAIAELESGKLDMIPVIFHTDERAQFMDFTIPYIEVPTSVFVFLGRSFSFATLSDLKGRAGLMVKGDSISPEFKLFESKLNMTKVSKYEHVFRMLVDNRADYAVAAKYGFLIEAEKLGYGDKIEILPVPIATRQLHIAFSKKSTYVQYLPLVNKKLKQLQADGSIQKIVAEAIRMAAGK